MPDHSPQHMARLSQASAATRRADKLARLIASSPLLTKAQAERLQALLESRIDSGAVK